MFELVSIILVLLWSLIFSRVDEVKYTCTFVARASFSLVPHVAGVQLPHHSRCFDGKVKAVSLSQLQDLYHDCLTLLLVTTIFSKLLTPIDCAGVQDTSLYASLLLTIAMLRHS